MNTPNITDSALFGARVGGEHQPAPTPTAEPRPARAITLPPLDDGISVQSAALTLDREQFVAWCKSKGYELGSNETLAGVVRQSYHDCEAARAQGLI